MIKIDRITNLFGYGEGARNWTVEEVEAASAVNGKRAFAAYPTTSAGLEDTQYFILLAEDQESCLVTKVGSGDRRPFLCANNTSAEELFGQSILPSAEAYLK